ncbi:hypothetical protein MPNT_250006 [Candidatus Methylacidithermus pantelleriae]|uniref:Uncharacterized protein n=1 Tax=Candidatus Methylacidithermus pantelleriae TaxID=2744239 RepID=A0A8J2FNU3_9BACT|nr:hypothetical protein MPNT_250006 [Candidatus Methylacidithermus pantelleriae]
MTPTLKCRKWIAYPIAEMGPCNPNDRHAIRPQLGRGLGSAPFSYLEGNGAKHVGSLWSKGNIRSKVPFSAHAR